MIRTSKIHKNQAGNSIQLKLSIPKDVADALKLKGGEILIWKLSKDKKLELDVEKQ